MIRFKKTFEPWQNIIIEEKSIQVNDMLVKVIPIDKNTLSHLFVYNCKKQYYEKTLPNEFQVAEIKVFNIQNTCFLKFNVMMWWHNGEHVFYMTLRKSGGIFTEEHISQKSIVSKAFASCVKGVEI